jgi:hypothetical protein
MKHFMYVVAFTNAILYTIHAAPQSASSTSFKIATQATGDSGSPVSAGVPGVSSTSFKDIFHIGRHASNLQATGTNSAKLYAGYIPTLQSGTPPPPPVITTTPNKKTNDNTPVITGTAKALAVVTVYEGPTPLGSATANAGGSWQVHTLIQYTNPPVALPDGPHALTARAADKGGTSGPSSPVTITIDTVPPAAVTGLRILSYSGVNDLFWDANAETDLLGYNVYRKIGATGGYTKLNTLPVSAPRYRDSGLTNGTAYYYKVAAADDAIDERSQYHP